MILLGCHYFLQMKCKFNQPFIDQDQFLEESMMKVPPAINFISVSLSKQKNESTPTRTLLYSKRQQQKMKETKYVEKSNCKMKLKFPYCNMPTILSSQHFETRQQRIINQKPKFYIFSWYTFSYFNKGGNYYTGLSNQ